MRLFTRIELLTPVSGVSLAKSAQLRAEEFEAQGLTVLKWGPLSLSGRELRVEFALADDQFARNVPDIFLQPFDEVGGRFRTAMVVPTGVGASVGGFIADAGPFARAVASMSSIALVHPNVVNGGDFYAGTPAMPYVDGYTLDEFLLGRLNLGKARGRRIGLLIEKMPAVDVNRLINAANAMRAIYGLDIACCAVTSHTISASISKSEFGHFLGQVDDADELLVGAHRLIEGGANAIAVVTAAAGISSVDWKEHYLESKPNPVGGLEAMISRFITRYTGLPCAHAPAYMEGLGQCLEVADPRAAGEIVSGTGLPCILLGLSRAPATGRSGGMNVRDLDAIILPSSCSCGIAQVAANDFGVTLLAVESNTTTVGVSERGRHVVNVATPSHALAWIACRRAGVAWSDFDAGLGVLSVV